MPTFTQVQRARLDALVEAVRQIEQASILTKAQSLSLRASIGQDGSVEEGYTLFDTEPFRSLAMSVRLVYMNGEPANFGTICSILHEAGEEDLREATVSLRRAYNDFLNGSKVTFALVVMEIVQLMLHLGALVHTALGEDQHTHDPEPSAT